MLDVIFLVKIGELATAEHEAWKARNAARLEYRKWLRKYVDETGEMYDHHALQYGGEFEDIAAHDALKSANAAAQSKLTTARAATRRAIVRALVISTQPPATPEARND